MLKFDMPNISVYNVIMCFFIYSLLGWLVEVAYAYKNQKKFVNRGFLNGPLCPIYGSCLLSIILLLSSYKGSTIGLFIMAIILTSSIEYFTGFLLEKLFNKKYWDYTEDPLNLHGRICLHFSIMWGFCSVMVVRYIHPTIIQLVDKIPYSLGISIEFMLLSLLLIDFYSTLVTLNSFKKIHEYLQIDIGAFTSKYVSVIQIPNFEDKFHMLKDKFFKYKR